MSNFQNPSSKQHVDNRTTAYIVVLLIATISITYVIQQVDFESKQLEDTATSINLTFTASVFAIVFIILEKNEINKYAIRVMNSLLAVYFPILSILPFFLDPIYMLGWFLVIYIGGMLLWFFIACPYVIGKENLKDIQDNNLKQFAQHSAIVMLRCLVWIFFSTIGLYIIALAFKEFFPP